MRAEGYEPDTRRQRRTSGRVIAKSISIKGVKRKSGGCARKVAELTSGELCRVRWSGLRAPGGTLTTVQQSAEGIVASTEPRGEGPNGRKRRIGHQLHERNAAEFPTRRGFSDRRAR